MRLTPSPSGRSDAAFLRLAIASCLGLAASAAPVADAAPADRPPPVHSLPADPTPTGPGPSAGAPAAPDPDERLRRLEEAFRAQSSRLEQVERELGAYRSGERRLLAPTSDEIGKAVGLYLSTTAGPTIPVAARESSGGLRWGGYFTLVYSDASNANSRFANSRLVLAADAEITPFIDFEMELEVENGGVGGVLSGEVELEKAEVTFHVCDALNPKLGWLLVPFGRYNAYHDDPINDFAVRPFTARFLVPTGFGQPGVGVEGALPFGRGHVFSYDVAATNGFRDAFSASRGTRDARQSQDENDGKQVWGRAAATWRTCAFDHLETGVSGTVGIYDRADEHAITGVALDLLVRKGPFEARAEYVAYDLERDADDPVDAVEGLSGFWAEAAWHFFPGYWTCRRNAFMTDASLFTLAVRYQTQDLHDRFEGLAFEDDLEALGIALSYRITERIVFRAERAFLVPATGSEESEWTFSFSTYL